MDYNDFENDVSFLFSKDKWNGTNIKNMDSSHIINTLLMLERKSGRYKTNYELFIIDHINEGILVPRDSIDDIVNMNSVDWIKTTPIYHALNDELFKRGLLSYFHTVQKRFENNEESTNQ